MKDGRKKDGRKKKQRDRGVADFALRKSTAAAFTKSRTL